MPAAAVIPAPVAYTNAVAVKKLVVGFVAVGPLARRAPRAFSTCFCQVLPPSSFWGALSLHLTGRGNASQIFYFEENGVLKAGTDAMNELAWNNDIGLWFYFVGFQD